MARRTVIGAAPPSDAFPGGAPTGQALPSDALTPEAQRFIRQRMQQVGLTQRELASQIGVDETTLSKVLHRKRGARLHQLVELARVLGVDFGDLLAGASSRPADAAGGPPPAGPRPDQAAATSILATTVAQLQMELQRIKQQLERAPVLRRPESHAYAAGIPAVTIPVVGRIHASASGGFIDDSASLGPVLPLDSQGRLLVAFPVNGDCMAPEIQEGDRVIVDCSEAAREAPDGLPMAVRLTGGEDVVVKRLYRRRDAAGRLVELTLEDNHGQRALAGPELNEVEIVGRILQVNKPIESVMARRAARRTPRRDQ